jgi:hypothetical protein
MFVRYFLNLPYPAGDVEQALLQAPERWIPALARDARQRGEALLARVGFEAAGLRVAKRVEIHIGQARRFPSKTILPVSWKATGPSAMFPVMDGDIEVAPLGPRLTQLSFSGRYEPPLSVLGRALDRALLHRVAEATVKDFLDRVGDRLAALAAEGLPDAVT